MTELVHQRLFLFALANGEIEMLEGKFDIERGGILKMFVHLVDARIDDGPDDVFAFGEKRASGSIRFDGADRAVDQRVYGEVLPNTVNGCVRRRVGRRR